MRTRGKVTATALQRLQTRADSPRGGGGVGPPHRVDPAERLVEHQCERVEVSLLAGLVAFALLRRHVGEGAEHVAGAGQGIFSRQARAAEVGQLGGNAMLLAARGVRDEHVLGLDVAMDDPPLMGMLERVEQGEANLQDLLVGKRLLGDQVGERLPLDQLGDQVEGFAVRACLIQGDDRGVRQPCGGLRLAGGPLAVALRSEPDPLDRDLAPQQLVTSAPHDSESAGAEAFQQEVALQHQLLHGLLGDLVDRMGATKGNPAGKSLRG